MILIHIKGIISVIFFEMAMIFLLAHSMFTMLKVKSKKSIQAIIFLGNWTYN